MLKLKHLPIVVSTAFSCQAMAIDGSCDKDCLEGFADVYMEALVGKNPEKLPVSNDVKFTENGQQLSLGEALWKSISAWRDYRIYMSDPQAGQVALFTVVEEHGLPVLMALRLEVEAEKITEVETWVVRSAGVFDAEALQVPRPHIMQSLNEEERRPRDEMIRIADLYLEGLEKNTGTIVPFAKECERYENGVVTSSGVMGIEFSSGDDGPCQTQFNSGIFSFITHIEPRRYLVVDEERGLVMGVFRFNHRGDVSTAHVPGHGEVDLPAAALRPMSGLAAEFFKIKDGLIYEVEAILMGLPYGTGTGWE